MSKLTAIDLQKKFKDRIVVNKISLELSSGQCIGLLGPNGAGKTTCFYMMVGLQNCDAGLIYLDDLNITKYPIHKRARLGIGYLPQEASIFRKMNVRDNIYAILQLRKDLTKEQRLDKLEQLLEEFHITHLTKILGMSLSGGERRRVEIARALAIEPLFIFFDEPFAGIDPVSVLDIKKIIQHLCQKNIGILITDHNVRETLNICDHLYIVNNGKIICSGNEHDILQNKLVQEIYLGENFV